MSALWKLTGTGLQQRKIGSDPANFLELNIPLVPEYITPNY